MAALEATVDGVSDDVAALQRSLAQRTAAAVAAEGCAMACEDERARLVAASAAAAVAASAAASAESRRDAVEWEVLTSALRAEKERRLLYESRAGTLELDLERCVRVTRGQSLAVGLR